MDSKMTISGSFVRQTAALVFTLLLFWAIGNANAAPTSSGSVGAGDQALLIQGAGAMGPAASAHLTPAAGAPAINSASGPATQLWPSVVSYSRVVDWAKPYLQSDLHLGIDYTFQFNIQMSARDSESRSPAVPDGWYELDMAVVLPKVRSSYLEAAGGKMELSPYERFVTSRSMLVQVSGGVVNRQITLRFPNLSATTIANHLYVSLTPIAKYCILRGQRSPCIQLGADNQPDLARSTVTKMEGYRPSLLDIAFVPYIPAGAGTANPDDAPLSPNPAADSNLPSYIAAAKAFQAAQRSHRPAPAMSPQQFANQSGLVYMSTNDILLHQSAEQWNVDGDWTSDLRALMNSESLGTVDLTIEESSLWSELCAALVMTNEKTLKDLRSTSGPIYNSMTQVQSFVHHCSVSAPAVFRLTVVDHIYRFDAANVIIDSMQPLRFSLATNFMVSRSHSRDSFTNFNAMELLFKAFDTFGIPLRALGISHGISVSDSRSQSEGASGQITLGLDFNVMPVRIPATRWQRCLEVRPVANRQLPFYDDTPTAKHNGLYLCDDVKTTPREAGDVYAHVFAHSGDTSMIDSFSPLAQAVNVALRGDRDISTFFTLIRQSLTPDHDSRILPSAATDTARAYFANTPSTQAGLIIRPVRYQKENVPSFAEMVFGSYRETFLGSN